MSEIRPYNFKLTRDRLRLLDMAASNYRAWAECYLATPENAHPCMLLAFWSFRSKSIRPASEVALWETMRDESDRKLSQGEAEALSKLIPAEAEAERRHYERLATMIRTEGWRKCKSMLNVIRTGIANWRPEDRPLLERTLEIAMNCDWRDLAIEDLFCAVVGDEPHRRLLAEIFRAGRGSVAPDLELSRFWDRAAQAHASLVASGRVAAYSEHLKPPMPPGTRVEVGS